MNLKFSWSRRSFLAALASITGGGLFAPPDLKATGFFGKKHEPSGPPIDGNPIVLITRCTSSKLMPPARLPTTTETGVRVPRMTGLPRRQS